MDKLKSLIFYIGLILLNFCFSSSFSQNKEFPYKLNKTTDAVLLSTAISSSLLYYYLDTNYPINLLTENEVLNMDRNNINSFDRSATYNWSPKADNVSDYLRDGLKYAPALIIIPEIINKQWSNIFTLGIMYLEGYLINSSFTSNTKITVQRIRPYMYNNELSEDSRMTLSNEETTYKSFYSGHTSSAFFNAVFISKVVTDIYGESGYTYAVWGICLTAAATTGYLRYEAGKHFPSDIIVGAIAGGAIGYLIPVLHKQNDNKLIVLITPDNQIGLKIIF
jgi:membrane-associated phospholipid phosphatase